MNQDREVPVEYAACRAWGHAWDFTTVDRSGGEYLQGMRCLRCPTHRTVRINARSGRREHGNKYLYPEDIDPNAVPYKMPKGSGGQLSPEERGQVTLGFIKIRYDEVAARRQKKPRKRA